MFLSRKKRSGPDPFLHWKVRIFLAGAFLALLGMALGSSLLVGMVLRFLPRKEEDGPPGDQKVEERTHGQRLEEGDRVD